MLRAFFVSNFRTYYIRQFLANSVASFVVQSPLGLSFIAVHHSGEPTDGEHALTAKPKAATKLAASSFP